MTRQEALFPANEGGTRLPGTPGGRPCAGCGRTLPAKASSLCARCRRLGLTPGRLELDPETETAGAGHPDPEPRTDLAGIFLAVTGDATSPTSRTGDGRSEHRARCTGVLMAPVFGLGRTSCNVCDWSPSDG